MRPRAIRRSGPLIVFCGFLGDVVLLDTQSKAMLKY